MKNNPSLIDRKVDTKLILMAAWIALMCLYIYCDIFSLYRPGVLDGMSGGKMGPFETSQTSLFLAGLLMVIPALMILVSSLATARISRTANLIIAPVYFLVNVGNLMGETWAYYYLFGLLELGLVVWIFIIALRWPRE